MNNIYSQLTAGTRVQVNTASGWENATVLVDAHKQRGVWVIKVKYDAFPVPGYVAPDQGIRLGQRELS